MATDPTTIPSVVDLQKTKKSMTDIDTFIDSGNDSFTDNNGQTRRTLTGINSEITQQLLEINKSRGYRVVGTFATGFEYELFNDVGIDASGNSWIYVGTGAPVKTVTAGTVPSAPDYQQVTFNSIDGVVGLRDELNDRALTLTLAEAQASDLKVGQYVRLTDYDNELYSLVLVSDTGGHYIDYDVEHKLKLVKTHGDITLLGAGYISGDVTPTLNSLLSNTSILNISSKSRPVEFLTECTITRPITLDLQESRVDNRVAATIVSNLADASCLKVDARYTKIILGYWYGNTNLSLAVRGTSNATDLWITRGFCTEFGGQCIETDGGRNYLEKIATTNSQSNADAIGRGTIRIRGDRSKIDGLTCNGNFGKSVVLDADNCTLENFDIHLCYNIGSTIGGIGIYSPYRETKGTVIKDGLVDRAGSHLIKLSGGLRSCKVKDVDLYNDSATVSESFENAMCLLSGTHNVTVEGGTVTFYGTLSSPIDCFQLTIHTNPDTESIGNTIKNVNFLDNPTGQHPRLVNIVGSSGALKAKENTIDGIEGKGFITLGAWDGDDNNVLQNSKISYDSFATIQANGGNKTKIINNPLIENTRTDSDGHCIRADGGDDFSVDGNTFRSFSIGVRTNKSNTWVTRNNFKNPLAVESPRTIRCLYFTAGATGYAGGNVYRETPNNIGETFVTLGTNDIVGV